MKTERARERVRGMAVSKQGKMKERQREGEREKREVGQTTKEAKQRRANRWWRRENEG